MGAEKLVRHERDKRGTPDNRRRLAEDWAGRGERELAKAGLGRRSSGSCRRRGGVKSHRDSRDDERKLMTLAAAPWLGGRARHDR